MGEQSITWELLWSHRNIIYKEIRRAGIQHDAEDIVTSVLLRTYKYKDSYNPKFALATWIKTITKRHLIDMLRRATVTDRKKAFLQVEYQRQLTGYMDKEYFDTSEYLPECPEMVQLLERGMTYEQIGKLLEMPTGTVKSSVSRLRNRLEAALK